MLKVKENWKQYNGKYKCPYCNKEYSKMGISSHIWRLHEDGIGFNPNLDLQTGVRKIWNKGLTKKVDKRIKKYGETFSKKYKGKIKLSEEFKHRISENKKEYFKKFPDKHPNRLCAGIKESYPETMIRELFEQNGMKKGIDFVQQYSKIKPYFIDFFIPSINLGIEVDGERWHDLTSEKEIERQKNIENNISLKRFWAKTVLEKKCHNDLMDIINKWKMKMEV